MIGVLAFAEKFNISQYAVRKWCREGKIPGVEQDGKGQPWCILEDAIPPMRKRNAEKKR